MRGLGLLTTVALVAVAGMSGTATAGGSGKLHPQYHRISSGITPMTQGVRDGSPCAGDRSVLSGGIDLEGAYGTGISVGYLPLDTDFDGTTDTYRAIGDNISGGTVFMGSTNVCANVDDVTTREAFETSLAFQRTTLKVDCANNEHVTGGSGFGDAPYGEVRLAESKPFDDNDKNSVTDDGWRISIDNISGSNYDSLVYAHCATRLDGLSYVAKEAKAKASARYDKTLACPKGKKAIGGGLGAKSDAGVGVLVTSRHTLASDTTWDTTLDNDDTSKVPVT